MFFKKIKGFIKSKKIILLVLTLIIILTCIFSSFFLFNIDNPFENIKYGKFSNLNKDDKILIFSPHPDDETIATAGLIQKAKEKNASVLIVCVTDGSAALNRTNYEYFVNKYNIKTNQTLAETRNQELIKALDQLGLNKTELIWLGYLDTGLKSMFETNWEVPYNKTYFSSSDEIPSNYSYMKNESYTGKNLDNDIKSIINDFKPTIVIYPDSNDILPDHYTTNAFVNQALIETNYSGLLYTYLVHTEDSWPHPPFYFPWEKMKPPSSLSSMDVKWIPLYLNSEELDIKSKALNNYQSQLFGGPNYLLSFLKSNELFIEYPNNNINDSGI